MSEEANAALAEMRRQSDAQNKMMKRLVNINIVTCLVCACILIITSFAALTLGPRIHKLVTQAQGLTTQLELVMQDLQTVSRELSDADLDGMLRNVDELVKQSQSGISTAMEKVGAIDIQSLNNAIADLNRIIKPLAGLFGKD
ncbi:MAG: hypothetical protein PHD32_12100 [Eubacteriales bacterium]|nr:hypothetical protein [Eubacteriales bacterium]